MTEPTMYATQPNATKPTKVAKVYINIFIAALLAFPECIMGGSMAVDATGRVWLGGATNSPDLPTRNPHQATYGGGDFDGFLAAFSPDGSKLCYGSYVGGNGHDMLEGLAVGSAIGAAAGVAWILATRGKEIVLPHGTSLELLLGQPVDFDREELEPPSNYDAGPKMPRQEYGSRN